MKSIKNLDKRIDGTNKRIDLLRQGMNKRFDNQQVLIILYLEPFLPC